MNDVGEGPLAPNSGGTREESGVWPPPPAGPPAEDTGPPPKPGVTDRDIGRASLALSALGSLAALAYVLSSAIDPHDRWNFLWSALLIGSVGGFFAAFFVGLVGWYSWEGKVGLCCALLLPLLWFMLSWLLPWP